MTPGSLWFIRMFEFGILDHDRYKVWYNKPLLFLGEVTPSSTPGVSTERKYKFLVRGKVRLILPPIFHHLGAEEIKG